MALTKKEKEKLENEYERGVYSPKEIWNYREIPYFQMTSEQRYLVSLDDEKIMELRKKEIPDSKSALLLRGNNLKERNPNDPYGDVPDCKPLRPDGDPREDVYCLLPEERELLKGEYYGMTFEKYPQLKFMKPFTDEEMNPNQTVIYYNTTKDGVPTVTANKYAARFYGQFDDEPFTEVSLHKHKGTDKERRAVPIHRVRKRMIENRKKTEENRARIYALEDEASEYKEKRVESLKRRIRYREKRLEKYNNDKLDLDNEKVIEYQEDLKDYKKELVEIQNQKKKMQQKADNINFFDGVDNLDKPFTKVDGTDTFRDAIAIHDAPHSVALFLNELEKDKDRPYNEQNRQFAIHNIVRLAFPYGLEYVKYYTQGGVIDDLEFPLVITSPLTSTETDLQENGLPKSTARWCTRMYKEEPSENFYKREDLFGINQLLGMTRFQSGTQTSGRKSRQPATKLSKLSLKTENLYMDGDPDEPPKLPVRAIPMPEVEEIDEFGDGVFYDIFYYSSNKEKWKVKKFIPKEFKIYQTQPIFDWTDQEQLDKMDEYGAQISPIIEDLDFHGCLLCPMRNAEYYRDLYENHRFLWSIADDMRRAGSYRKTKKGEDEYYYFYKPYEKKNGKKIPLSMEEAAEKDPDKFIRDDAGTLRPIM